MSNILVQFPEIQQAINQAGSGSVTLGPPTFKKSAVEYTELVSDSTGIHLNHWGWGSNDAQKETTANAFKLSQNFSRVNYYWSGIQAYVTMNKGSKFYYKTDQTIDSLGIIGSSSNNIARSLVSFNLNRLFFFEDYTISNVWKQTPVLQKIGGD